MWVSRKEITKGTGVWGNNLGKVRRLKERVAGICIVGEKKQFLLEKFVEKG